MSQPKRPIVFRSTTGFCCAETAMEMALATLYPSFQKSLSELQELTRNIRDRGTFMVQISSALLDLKIPHRYYARKNILEGLLNADLEREITEIYKPFHLRLLAWTDSAKIKQSITTVLNSLVLASPRPTLDQLRLELDQGNVIICLIDNTKIFDYQDHSRYRAHFVALTGIDSLYVTYHDSGPKTTLPNRRVTREQFESAWSLCWFDDDLLIVESFNQ